MFLLVIVFVLSNFYTNSNFWFLTSGFGAEQWKYYVLAWKYPGPLGLPFIGIAWKTLNPHKLFKTVCELKLKYKSPLTFWMGTMCFLYIDDIQSIQDVLLTKDCSDKGTMWSTITRAIGETILTAKYDTWIRLRRLTSPWFSSKGILQFTKFFNNNADNMVKLIDNKVGQGFFDMRELIKPTTFDIAYQTMGGNIVFDEEERDNILLTATKAMELCIKPWYSPWLLIDWVYKLTKDYDLQKQHLQVFRDAIYKSFDNQTELEKEKDLIFQDENSDDVVTKGFILENNGDITRAELESNSYIFITTAFETMAAHLFLTILCLAMNSECQEKLGEELLAHLPEDPEFEVTIGDVKDLKYLDMVFNESLRLLPTIPFTIRNVTNDFTLRSGVTVPKGTQILINIFSAHRNEEFWGKDAHQFNPDHFLPENVAKLHPFAFVPFLKGVRTCIGSKYAALMSKVFLCKLFRKYRFRTEAKLEDLEFAEEISLAIKNPALIEAIRI